MQIYYSRQESQLLVGGISKPFVSNMLKKSYIRNMKRRNIIIDYQMRAYSLGTDFVFYRTQYLNQFKRRIQIYLVENELGRKLINLAVKHQISHSEFIYNIETKGKLIKAFVANLRRLDHEII